MRAGSPPPATSPHGLKDVSGQRGVSGPTLRSGKRTKGSKWLRTALTEAAHAAAPTKGSYLSAHYYAGIKGLRGSKKAAVAVGHSILVICYHILKRNVPHEDLGEEHFHKQRRCSSEAYTRRVVRNLERLGHKVALEPLVGST
jgi:transposase